MKIFGKEVQTKKKLKARIAYLEEELASLRTVNGGLYDRLAEMTTTFPLELGQTVYDVQLRNANGRYTKKHPSLEHSLINEVVVDTKNYFGLVERMRKLDVFRDREGAQRALEFACGVMPDALKAYYEEHGK
jgi:hypothetical protein